MAKTPARNGVNSVDIAMTMLKAIAGFRRPVLLSEIARELRISPGKVHRYFVSFVRVGLLAQQPETGRYELGHAALFVGLSALEQIDAVRFASEQLPNLRDKTGLTTLLAVWGDVGPVVVRLEESKDRVKQNVRVGSVLTVLTSAIGRVFMTYLPAGQADSLIRREKAHSSLVAKMSVEKISTDVRRHGLSRIDSFGLPGVSVMAAPILDHQGYPAAVMAVLAMKDVDRLTVGGPTSLILKNYVHAVSKRLGHVEADENATISQAVAKTKKSKAPRKR
jgi:DNA-binding IclR family transcriptional regulator